MGRPRRRRPARKPDGLARRGLACSLSGVLRGLLLIALTLCFACATKPAPAAVRATPETHVGPLSHLVTPGASLVLVAQPKLLAESAAMRSLWRSMVFEDREREFVARTGVEPFEVTELVVLEVPPAGYVLMARGPFIADEVVRRAGARIAVLDVTSDAPVVRREGLRGDGRYAYVALDTHAMLAAKDTPPELIGEILLRARDPKAPSAFDASDAHALESAHAGAPLMVFQLAPIPFQPGTPIALLFARQRALAVAVRPSGTQLAISVDLRGEFPPGAEQNFRTLVSSIGKEPLGASLGLSAVAQTMGVRLDEQGVLLTASLESAAIEGTLKLMFAREIRELFE